MDVDIQTPVVEWDERKKADVVIGQMEYIKDKSIIQYKDQDDNIIHIRKVHKIDLNLKKQIIDDLDIYDLDSADYSIVDEFFKQIRALYGIHKNYNEWQGSFIPDHYDIKDELLYKIKKEDDYELLSSTPFIVTGIGRDLDEGDYWIEVTLQDIMGNIYKEWIRQDELFSKSGAIRLIKKGLSFTESEYKTINKYLKECYAINAKYLPKTIISNGYGWKNNYFVVRDQAIKRNSTSDAIVVGVDDHLAYQKKGTLQGWIDSTKEILEYNLIRFKIYAALVPIIQDIAVLDSFIVHDVNNSGTGKTISLKVAMSVLTEPKPFDAKSTKRGTTLLNEVYSNLPIFFDEIGDDPNFPEKVYDLTNPNSRVTSTQSQELKAGKRFRTVVQSTGERRITSENNYEGEHVRVIHINDKLPYIPDIIRKVEKGIFNNYGHILDLYIRKVCELKDKIPHWYDQKYDDLPEYETPQSGRIKAFFAGIALAGEILEDVFREIGIESYNPDDVVFNYYKESVAENPFEKHHIQVLRKTYDWFLSNRNKFVYEQVDNNGNTTQILDHEIDKRELYGWYSKEYIDIIPTVLTDYFMTRYRMDIKTAISNWKDYSITKTEMNRRNQERAYKMINNERKRQYFIRIRRDQMEAVLGIQNEPFTVAIPEIIEIIKKLQNESSDKTALIAELKKEIEDRNIKNVNVEEIINKLSRKGDIIMLNRDIIRLV